MTRAVKTTQLLGFLLIGLAVVLLLTQTAIADSIVGAADGKKVSCYVWFDHNSAKGATCSTIDTCRVGGLFSFFGVFEDHATVRIQYEGVTYASQKFTTSSLGGDEHTTMSACVPASATTVTVQVLDESGNIAGDGTKVATL